MKKLVCVLLSLAMMTAAFSCGQTDDEDKSPKTSASEKDKSEDTSEEENEEETEAETEEEPEEEPETVAETTEGPEDPVIDPMPAYKQAIEHIYYAAEEPINGYDLSDPDYMISDDQFALFDVDKDGRDELIFLHTATCMAGMIAEIYDVDVKGILREEFGSSPFMHYYSNGIITIDDSHNQGVSGSFWPYSVCRYVEGVDTYVWAYYVSAWDKEAFPEDYYTGETFPDEADTSGTGFVYYISDASVVDASAVLTEPVDVTVYNEWYESVFGGANEENPVFYNITEDNIAAVFGND